MFVYHEVCAAISFQRQIWPDVHSRSPFVLEGYHFVDPPRGGELIWNGETDLNRLHVA